jgi:hypothetical protein
MAGFDPLAGIVADAALAQSSVAAIDLGIQIDILQQQLQVGDLLTATVLPPQNGVDLLSFLGQTVQAQLPPGIDPGQTLLLQVTGFQGNQILVQNIGVVDPNNPPLTVNVTLPPPEPGAPTQATLYTVQPPNAQPAPQLQPAGSSVTPSLSNGSPQTPPPSATPPLVAPPRAVFVAASVQPVMPNTTPTTAVQKSVPIVVPPENELALEARIAATRAASIDIEELVNQPAPSKPAPSQPTAPQAASQPLRATPPPPAPVSIPTISPRAATPTPAMAADLAMLARLRIPALPFTLSAARLANTAASALPKALARLDALLEQLPQTDARAATVRTIAAFLDKVDLSNTRALPEQLMSYINNVVGGAESKLAALVRALTIADDEPAPTPSDNSQPAPPGTAAQPSDGVALSLSNGDLQSTPASTQAANLASAQPAVAAHAAERAVALQYDLKTAIAALAESLPRGASPQLAGALSDALTTITAAQLNVANGQTNDPNSLVIPLPVFYYEGGRPAQLRISRDAPEGGKKLDSDNFHIAFILDTKSLGTVAVDVQTASRSVSVNVKTEVQTATNRFRDTFADLRGRLEQLHYRVANIAANVAPHLAADVAPSNANRTRSSDGRKSNLDLQA